MGASAGVAHTVSPSTRYGQREPYDSIATPCCSRRSAYTAGRAQLTTICNAASNITRRLRRGGGAIQRVGVQ